MPSRESAWGRYRRWSTARVLRGLPEWRLFADERSRASAIERMNEEVGKWPVFGWGVLAIALGGTVLVNASFPLVPIIGRMSGWIRGSTPWWLTAGVIALIIGVCSALIVYLWRRGIARLMREHLLRSGVPVCLACGYPLRGIEPRHGGVCPECGAGIDPRAVALLDGESSAETVIVAPPPRPVPPSGSTR